MKVTQRSAVTSDERDRMTDYYRRPRDERRLMEAMLLTLVEIKRRIMNLEACLQEFERHARENPTK